MSESHQPITDSSTKSILPKPAHKWTTGHTPNPPPTTTHTPPPPPPGRTYPSWMRAEFPDDLPSDLILEAEQSGFNFASATKEDVKRETHRLVERRRRQIITSALKDLARIVPNCMTKNKAHVIQLAVEYIQWLRGSEMRLAEQLRYEKLVAEETVKDLEGRIESLLAETRIYKDCLRQGGLAIPKIIAPPGYASGDYEITRPADQHDVIHPLGQGGHVGQPGVDRAESALMDVKGGMVGFEEGRNINEPRGMVGITSKVDHGKGQVRDKSDLVPSRTLAVTCVQSSHSPISPSTPLTAGTTISEFHHPQPGTQIPIRRSSAPPPTTLTITSTPSNVPTSKKDNQQELEQQQLPQQQQQQHVTTTVGRGLANDDGRAIYVGDPQMRRRMGATAMAKLPGAKMSMYEPIRDEGKNGDGTGEEDDGVEKGDLKVIMGGESSTALAGTDSAEGDMKRTPPPGVTTSATPQREEDQVGDTQPPRKRKPATRSSSPRRSKRTRNEW